MEFLDLLPELHGVIRSFLDPCAWVALKRTCKQTRTAAGQEDPTPRDAWCQGLFHRAPFLPEERRILSTLVRDGLHLRKNISLLPRAIFRHARIGYCMCFTLPGVIRVRLAACARSSETPYGSVYEVLSIGHIWVGAVSADLETALTEAQDTFELVQQENEEEEEEDPDVD
jgi:hypothetical protein